ncbi:putative transposase, partial [Loktanella salsilacus]
VTHHSAPLVRHLCRKITAASPDPAKVKKVCDKTKRFLQRLINQFGEPRVVITDKLRSYVKPIRTLAADADHPTHRGLNNAIEGSHRPTRKREKIFGRFKSHRQAQRFLSAHNQINLIFRTRRFQLTANSYRHARADAFSLWAGYTIEMVA